MKIKGICKDCVHRWQYGAKGQPQHLYCSRVEGSRIVKNTNMQSCPHYEKANDETFKVIRKRAMVR